MRRVFHESLVCPRAGMGSEELLLVRGYFYVIASEIKTRYVRVEDGWTYGIRLFPAITYPIAVPTFLFRWEKMSIPIPKEFLSREEPASVSEVVYSPCTNKVRFRISNITKFKASRLGWFDVMSLGMPACWTCLKRKPSEYLLALVRHGGALEIPSSAAGVISVITFFAGLAVDKNGKLLVVSAEDVTSADALGVDELYERCSSEGGFPCRVVMGCSYDVDLSTDTPELVEFKGCEVLSVEEGKKKDLEEVLYAKSARFRGLTLLSEFLKELSETKSYTEYISLFGKYCNGMKTYINDKLKETLSRLELVEDLPPSRKFLNPYLAPLCFEFKKSKGNVKAMNNLILRTNAMRRVAELFLERVESWPKAPRERRLLSSSTPSQQPLPPSS